METDTEVSLCFYFCLCSGMNLCFTPRSCCLRFSMIPGVSTNVTRSSSLWGISMPINFSKKFWPNFSRGEKERELSAAMTIPSTERIFSPCMITVNSEVVGSAPTEPGIANTEATCQCAEERVKILVTI